MGRDGDETLDGEELPTTEPQLHQFDGLDLDAEAYDGLEVPPRPEDDDDVVDFPL